MGEALVEQDLRPDEKPGPRPERRLGRRRIIGIWILAAIAVVIAAFSINLGRPGGTVDTPIVGRAAPTFVLETLDGGQVSLADLKGKPIILNFWASWCIPCREEAPLLTGAAAAYSASGLRVLGVVYQDSAENARKFMLEYGQTYPGLLDPEGRTAIDYGVFGIPETFFIDRDGIVRSHQVGALVAADLKRQVERILP